MEFPPTSTALEEPNGLLAVGGDLSVHRLLSAYCQGIFPWYQDDQPILWWSPNPRMVLKPNSCHTSRSMKKFLRKTGWRVQFDVSFESIIHHCAMKRVRPRGTWITDQMKEAYIALFRRGFAHSIEVRENDTLVGGLYGVSIGKIFFGESMFSLKPNASKMAMITLAHTLHQHNFRLIDCQVASEHLYSLGAEEISREHFELELSLGITEDLVSEGQQVWRTLKNTSHSSHGYFTD